MKNIATIGTCPVCLQGGLVIAKEKKSGIEYVLCEDCESEWRNPYEAADIKYVTRDRFGESRFLSLEEVTDHPWKGFIK